MPHNQHRRGRTCARKIVYTQRTGWGLLSITKWGKSALSSGICVKQKLCAFDARFAFFFSLSLSLSLLLLHKHMNAELHHQLEIQTISYGEKFHIITSETSRDVFLLIVRQRYYFSQLRSIFRDFYDFHGERLIDSKMFAHTIRRAR